MKSLLICGHCGKEAKKYGDNEKVIFKDYADILCYSCKAAFEDSIEDVAIRYLDNRK